MDESMRVAAVLVRFARAWLRPSQEQAPNGSRYNDRPQGRTTMAVHRIAVMPGDGIGKEVVPEGQRVLEAAAKKFGIEFAFTHFDWSCDYYARHGRMMPEDWFEQLHAFEAIYYGAVGWPATVPDHVSLWG
jgi:Isocitrate/isopropylmalate dehydrogenase